MGNQDEFKGQGQPGRFERTVQLWDQYRAGSNRSTFGTVPLEYQLFSQYIVGTWMIAEAALLRENQQLREALANLLAMEQRTFGDTPPYGHACCWCHDCCERARNEARAALAPKPQEVEKEPRHRTGCICADCSSAELTTDND